MNDDAAPRVPPPRIIASLWRRPTDEERFIFRAEAQLLDHFGHTDYHARSTINLIAEMKILHNRAGAWEFVLLYIPHVASPTVCNYVTPMAVALRHSDIGFEYAQDDLEQDELRRLMRPGERRSDYKGAKNPETGKHLRPSEKPITGTYPRREGLRRFYAVMGKTRPHEVVLELPRQNRRLPLNAITWCGTKELERGQPSLQPDDLAFSHLHLVGLSLPQVRWIRCSWVRPVQGRPAIVTPFGIAWLGEFAPSIEGLRNRRFSKVSEDNPDPLLNSLGRPKGFDVESPITPEVQKTRLRKATGLLTLQPSRYQETGIARGLYRGVPPEYYANIQGLGKKGVQALEDLAARVLNAKAHGTHLGLDKPIPGWPRSKPGFCPVCRCPVAASTQRHCATCLAPVPLPGVMP